MSIPKFINTEKQKKLVQMMIEDAGSGRALSRMLSEDSSDVNRWGNERPISARAVIKICKLYDIAPSDLRPDIFPEGLRFTYQDDSKE